MVASAWSASSSGEARPEGEGGGEGGGGEGGGVGGLFGGGRGTRLEARIDRVAVLSAETNGTIGSEATS